METLKFSWVKGAGKKASIRDCGVMLYNNNKPAKLIPYHMIKEIQYED